ncbi:hypothetical protein LTS18_001344, partial [Coniosporium uncinatum]
MEPAVVGAFYTAETLLEGAVAFGKGILYPTLPLKATFSRISGARIPRSSHTVSIIKGRTYVFGGETSPGEHASNDMGMIVLPSSAVTDADYTFYPARPTQSNGPVPAARLNHTASVVGDSIYIFGGQLEGGAQEEQGRIWVFETVIKSWSYFDPAPNTPYLSARYSHSAAASELPGPEGPTIDPDILPQQPPVPGDTVNEPPASGSWGTLFIYGGKSIK